MLSGNIAAVNAASAVSTMNGNVVMNNFNKNFNPAFKHGNTIEVAAAGSIDVPNSVKANIGALLVKNIVSFIRIRSGLGNPASVLTIGSIAGSSMVQKLELDVDNLGGHC